MTKRTEEPKIPLWRELLGTALVLSFWGSVALFLIHGCETVDQPSRSQLEQRAACQYSHDHGGPGC